MSNLLYYYVTGNTAEGFVNHLETNVFDIEKVIILKHPSIRLKTAIIKKLTKLYDENQLEILESALGKDFFDGVIVRDQSVAFLDDRIAERGTDTINLTASFPAKEQNPAEVNHLTQLAYDSFAEGLKIHDELEEIYINQMDFDYADAFSEEFIENLLNNVQKKNRTAHTYTRLFGTNTVDGIVNVVPQLINAINKVYYIKGRAGTGKSTFMKKIAAACADHGIDVELYYCSFDPKSVDMVLVRDLDFCIFDSTDPHEFFPERKGEVIVDLYDEFIAAGTDEKFASEINNTNARYKSSMKNGIHYLKLAGEIFSRQETNYMKAVTEDDIEQTVHKIIQSLP
ncbi:hypothetical protein [Lentibacillus amyloliquefaciens]|uniref:ATPase n=1 Tax=Lentibacillus amyloliquefaciens TaxID=1472767 RepID=A0A0U3WB32_9BACI|nr:hypothetical protein [Lentibacillus amyloliquefaciens]ALX50336.1 hypothetical protein AOX59_18180 [Lentibacillus amyloliquefaciens]